MSVMQMASTTRWPMNFMQYKEITKMHKMNLDLFFFSLTQIYSHKIELSSTPRCILMNIFFAEDHRLSYMYENDFNCCCCKREKEVMARYHATIGYFARSTLPHRALEHNKFSIESQFYNSERLHFIYHRVVKKKKLQKIQSNKTVERERENFSKNRPT